MAKVIS